MPFRIDPLYDKLSHETPNRAPRLDELERYKAWLEQEVRRVRLELKEAK